MAVQTKGGFPVTIRQTFGTAPTALQGKILAPARTIHLRITNTDSTNALRIYWTEKDFTDDVNYVNLAAGDVWSEPAEIVSFWGIAQTAPVLAEITFFSRRG